MSDGLAAGAATISRSPVHAAVLALVVEQPSHTYEVCKRFDERFGSLIPVGTSRIYKAIKTLKATGLIEEMQPPRHRRGDPTAHRATAAGARTHRGWLAEDLRSDPLRAEIRRRLLSLTVHDATAVLDVIACYERACADEMAAAPLPPSPTDGASAGEIVDTLRDQLLAEEHRVMTQARLTWIAFARAHTQAAAEEIRRLSDPR